MEGRDLMGPRKGTFLLFFLISFSLVNCRKEGIPFFKPLKPVVRTLPDGMKLFLLEDHELPTAEVFLYSGGGSLQEPPGKEGLSSVGMQTIRLGGGRGRGADEIE